MKLPYCMSCTDQHALLYPLADGRFQIMEPAPLAPLMIGHEYVLVERELAEYLRDLDLPRLDVVDAVIYQPRTGEEIRTHERLVVGQRFSSDLIRDLNLDGERLLLMDNRWLFVSPPLKERLERSRFQYLRFSEGLREFAA